MSQVLNEVKAIYEAIEQGNIGKIISALDENFVIRLARSLGGAYKGREGILELVSKMCNTSGRIKKVITSYIDFQNDIVVLGNTQIFESNALFVTFPFADVWKSENGKITEADFFFMDPEILSDFIGEGDN
ncbi:nuclear transport factor 2 family protein [Flavitalea flava]